MPAASNPPLKNGNKCTGDTDNADMVFDAVWDLNGAELNKHVFVYRKLESLNATLSQFTGH